MTHSKTALVAIVLALATFGACSRQQSAPPAAQAQTPPAAGAAMASHPVSAAAGAPQGAQNATGAIVELIDAASYTYARVKADSGEIWAVAPRSAVKVGDRVVIPLDMPARDYHSQSLNRDFPLIYFTTAIAREGEAPTVPMTSPHGDAAAVPAAGAASARAAASAPESVKPAEGGTTVAAVWTNSRTLDGKTVTVRGKVVKFNGGILGRNWVHIQDGTGKPADGTHDLTVTTDGVVKVGDIVTVTGKVALNKDFGAGYTYRVMVEGATVAVK